MQKILFVNDFDTGGGAEVIFNQTINILKEDYICKKYVGSQQVIKPKSVLSYIFNIHHKKRIDELLFDFKPNIIHIHNYYHILSPSVLFAISRYKRRNNVLVVHTAHDFHLCFPNSGFHYFRNKKLINLKTIPSILKIILLNIDHRGHIYGLIKKLQWILAYKILKLHKVIDIVICPSYFLKNYLDIRFNRKVPVKMIRNPYELNLSYTKLSKIPSATLKMVFVGRVSFEKGLEEFLKTLIKYKYDYSFDIIGTGDEVYISRLQNITKEYKNIQYLGYIERNRVLEKLKEYDVLVLSSLLYENFPTVMLEGSSLGLKTLTIMRDALRLIEQNHGIKIDIDAIPLDDDKTYKIYQKGETNGTFQFESPGMQKHLINLKPDKFADLIAMNALYRPGPLEYIPNFIDRKHGREKISYDLPEMEEYLAETLGITVYQEQIMLLS
ncbi:MAG: glycosyltransferase, partial [Flavobacterium sp.]|nr:glycosyltransferase [Flavobacterium sp.]